MTTFYDALETREPAAREAQLMQALPGVIAAAQAVPALTGKLAGIDAAAVNSRAALARLPLTHKAELFDRQKTQRATDPFGGYSAIGWRGLRGLTGARRVYQSPGPIYEPDAPRQDYWRNRSGRCVYITPISRPPFEPPSRRATPSR